MAGRRMRFQHIETFRAVVMTGSMTKAAEQLHTSQPQVSRLIGQLEDIAGFPLFVRKGTNLSTSAEGARFFEEVEKSFRGLSQLEEAAGNIRAFRSEHLRVAAMPRLAGGVLAEAVAELKESHPDLMVSIHSGSACAVQGWLSSGKCDVGLAMVYGEPVSSMDIQPIMKSKCVCIVPAGHALATRMVLRPADFDGVNLIAFSPGSTLRTHVDAFFEGAGVQPRIVAETDLGASACKLVAAGVGVSLINPMAAAEEALDAKLVTRPVTPDILVTLALVYPPYRRHTLLMETFEDHARRVIQRQFGRFENNGLETEDGAGEWSNQSGQAEPRHRQ